VSWGVSPWVYPVWDSLGFLDLGDYFLPHFREVFNYYLLKYFLMVFLLVFFFWDSYDSNVLVFNIVLEVSDIVLISFNSFFFFPLWFIYFYHSIFSTQLSESLCIPDGGGHLGNWLLAGSVFLLFIPPFYPPGHLCLLPPSSLHCITPWTSLSGPDCGEHIRKWLLASLLSPILIPPHLIQVIYNSLLPLLFSM